MLALPLAIPSVDIHADDKKTYIVFHSISSTTLNPEPWPSPVRSRLLQVPIPMYSRSHIPSTRPAQLESAFQRSARSANKKTRAQLSSSAATLRAFACTVSTWSSRFRICARASRSSAASHAFSSLSADAFVSCAPPV